MIRYTPLKSILNYVAKGARDNNNDATLLHFALSAYRKYSVGERWKRTIVVLPIVDNVVELPPMLKQINRLTYICEQPCADDVDDLCSSVTTSTTNIDPSSENTSDNSIVPICATVYYTVFQETHFYRRAQVLKYIGVNTSLFCKDCPNVSCVGCEGTFSFNANNNLLIHTHSSGWVCLDYMGEIVDDCGDYLIPDDEDLKQGLAYYAEYHAAKERMWTKEEQMGNIANQTLQLAEIRLKSYRGSAIMRNIDPQLLTAIRMQNIAYLYLPKVWNKPNVDIWRS